MAKRRYIKLAFSLVELMIVVAVIGIVAAMVIPKVTNYSQEAKEAAAKENLHTLRAAIELYASKHDGIPPGYINNDPIAYSVPLGTYARDQLLNEHCLRQIPRNPFNDKATILCIRTNFEFPITGNYGYVYKPSTKTIKLDTPGTDSKGVLYSEY